MRSPSRGRFDQLASVSGSSARNAWAVGQYLGVGGDRTLALHWNGVSWRRVSTVNPAGQNSLTGVAVISKTDAWAVGFEFDHVSQQTLIEHWNGSKWLRVTSPSPPGNDALNAVTAIAADNIWPTTSLPSDETTTLEPDATVCTRKVPSARPHLEIPAAVSVT